MGIQYDPTMAGLEAMEWSVDILGAKGLHAALSRERVEGYTQTIVR